MSIGSSHVFNALTSKSQALPDQRLVRLIVKGKNRSENLQESLCVSIPVLGQSEVVDYIDQLLPYVVGMVHDVQDKIIREYRINTGAHDIHEHEFNMDKVIAWLAENATGERLTGAMLREWFTEEYADSLTQWIRELPAMAGATDDTIKHHHNAISKLIESFADVRFRFTEPQIRMLESFFASCEPDTRMMQLSARLEKQKQEQDAMNLESLGF